MTKISENSPFILSAEWVYSNNNKPEVTMKKDSKKISSAMQALLDMQNDGTTVAITYGEKKSKSSWVATRPDDDYLAYLSGDMSNQTDGLNDLFEYDDLEVESTFLD